jgi:DNA-binding NtrC family response regulator
MASVLLVEDDEGNLFTLTCILEQEGYSVSQARSLAEARQRLASLSVVDVVVTDWNLGDGPATSMISDVRERHPRARIVVISGDGTQHRSQAGVDAVLTKGRDLDELLRVLVRLTAGRDS